MCQNVFHEEPCNCDNSLYGTHGKAPSKEQQFKANYRGILTKEYAWRSYQEQEARKEALEAKKRNTYKR